MAKIEAPPSSRYRAVHQSGKRGAKDIFYVVIHCTEGDTAEGAARWFANPLSGGSTQLVVDDNEAFRCLPDSSIPWGAPPLNTTGLHIEIAGHASWSYARWLLHRKSLKRAAYFTAKWCKQNPQIPVRWVEAEGLAWLSKRGNLRKYHGGITSHANISQAFHVSDHTDPGPHFPVKLFMHYVKGYAK